MTEPVLLPAAEAPLRKKKAAPKIQTAAEAPIAEAPATEPLAAPAAKKPKTSKVSAPRKPQIFASASTAEAADATQSSPHSKSPSPSAAATASDVKPTPPKHRKPAPAVTGTPGTNGSPGKASEKSSRISGAAKAGASKAGASRSGASKTGGEALTLDEPVDALPPVSLAELPETLQKACANAGWAALMPVQERALPYLLQGRDLMVQSRTGSGKTGAYLLPLLARLSPKVQGVQALVLVPTRELASQVEQEARTLFGQSPFSVAAVYGGVGYGKQMDALRQGVTLVVGTPGRVLDHLLRRTMVLDKVSSLIFDEADRMLSIGFYPDMKEIQRYLPQTPRHAMLFSATYPPHVLRLAGEFLHEPELLSLSTKHVHVAEVQHRFCQCRSMDKDRVLLKLLEVENPTSAIIFCNTKATVHFVTAVLQGFGLNADELSADLSQNRREDVLDRLRKGTIRFLVATDVAARGIDIPELSHVFLYEPPDDRESYIHRSGRTGRAGAAGVVISLVDVMQKLELGRIAQFYKIPLEEQLPPADEDVTRAAGLRTTALLEARFRQLTGLERERVARLVPLIADMAADPEQQGLLAMALDEACQRLLFPQGLKTPMAIPAPPQSRSRDRGPRSGGGHRQESGGQRHENGGGRPEGGRRPGGRPHSNRRPRGGQGSTES